MTSQQNPSNKTNAQEDGQAEMLLEHLKNTQCFATIDFAKTILHFGRNAVEQLKSNAYMLSAMGDSPFNNVNNVGRQTEFDDKKTVECIDRCVALLVKKIPKKNEGDPDKFVMLKKGWKNDRINLTLETYNRVVTSAASCEKSVVCRKSMPKYGTAIQYLRAWWAFVQWSCDFASEPMTLNQVNSLVKETEKAMIPILKKVKGQTKANESLGIRHFITTTEKYNGTDTLQRLNQLLIEYRHLATSEVTVAAKEPKCVVIGIPSRNNRSTTTKAAMTNGTVTFHDIANSPLKEIVHPKANLNGAMVRRLWEIARVTNRHSMGKLMTYTHNGRRETKRDNTIQVLETVNNNKKVVIHEHYVGNYNCPNFFLQKHLQKALNEQQLTAFIIDYSWGGNDGTSGEYEASEDINLKNKTVMFDEIIPMLARMSCLSDV